jgi:hypothetical protein
MNGGRRRFRARQNGVGDAIVTTHIRRGMRGGQYDRGPDAEFGRVTVRQVSFAGQLFNYFDAEGTEFVDCDFSGAVMQGTFGVRHQTKFVRCRFASTTLAEVDPGQARFVEAVFDNADVRRWNAAANEFLGCRFTGSLGECNFWGRPSAEWIEGGLRRRVNEFRRNDFSGADLFGVSFLGGIDLAAQRLPDSAEYIRLNRSAERLSFARAIIETWPAEERVDARIMLEVLTGPGFDTQPELFAHRYDMGVPKPLADKFWALLETV